MAFETIFYVQPGDIAYHSNRGADDDDYNLHLIQQTTVIAPALPKLVLVDVPGANGSVDLTEVLGAGVMYNDRLITITYALYPGSDWEETKSRVSNAINGMRCRISFDDDPEWYYEGRVQVTDHSTDRMLRQITVEAICQPFKRRFVQSFVGATLSQSSYTDLDLAIGKEGQIPVITVSAPTEVVWGDFLINFLPGTNVAPELYMNGTQKISAILLDPGIGSISVSWREGSL